MKSIVASCLLVFITTNQAQWLNNYGYDLGAIGFVGGYYPANNGILSGYTGYPARSAPFHGFAHPGYWPITAYYPAASIPSYDIAGNQVGGYDQVQDTPEVAQAKAAHFAAHATAKAHLIQPVVTAVAGVIAAPTAVETTLATGGHVATPVSRQKRQIHPFSYTLPLTYELPSPLAYIGLAAQPGHSYGAPFGYHFANSYYGNQFYPVVSNVGVPVVGSPDAGTSSAGTATNIAPAATKTA